MYTQIQSYKSQIKILQEKERQQISASKTRNMQEKQDIARFVQIFEKNILSRLSNIQSLSEACKTKITTFKFSRTNFRFHQLLKSVNTVMQNHNDKLEKVVATKTEDIIFKIAEAKKVMKKNFDEFLFKTNKRCEKENQKLRLKINFQRNTEVLLKEKEKELEELKNSKNKKSRILSKLNSTMRIPAKSSPVPTGKSEGGFSSREEEKKMIPSESSEQSPDNSPSVRIDTRTASASSLCSCPVRRNSILSKSSGLSLMDDAKFKHVRNHIMHCLKLIPSNAIKKLEALIGVLYNLLEISVTERQAIEKVRKTAGFDSPSKSEAFSSFFN